MHPVGDDEAVALGLAVAQAVGDVVGVASRRRFLLPVVGVGIVGDLEVVLPELRVEAQLIFGGLVTDEGDEAALGIGGIVVRSAATGGARP